MPAVTGQKLTPFEAMPWDIIEHCFSLMEPYDIVMFACASKLHYALAHGYLWRNPHLSLTQAMIFVRFVYRRPIFTTSLPPSIGNIMQWERPRCVKTVSLYLEDESSDMFDIARDAVLRRLMGFCSEVNFEIHINQKDREAWIAPLKDSEKANMELFLYDMEEEATVEETT